eukprot:1668815-Amphidinium_carterae.1
MRVRYNVCFCPYRTQRQRPFAKMQRGLDLCCPNSPNSLTKASGRKCDIVLWFHEHVSFVRGGDFDLFRSKISHSPSSCFPLPVPACIDLGTVFGHDLGAFLAQMSGKTADTEQISNYENTDKAKSFALRVKPSKLSQIKGISSN